VSKKRKRTSVTRRHQARELRRQLDEAEAGLRRGKYEHVLALCEDILAHPDARGAIRADALEYMAHALIMLKRFEEAYQALSEAIKIRPKEAHLWYNRSMTGLFTTRSVQALRDIRRAQSLEGKGEMAEAYAEQRKFIEEAVQSELKLRGPDFTLEQLDQQQSLYRQAMTLFEAGQWQEAEELFRQVIAMGDCLPQPHNNLGICLLMQGRFDEAEAEFHRALEIDPKYKLARQQLKQLKKIRKTGQIPNVAVTNPFQKAKISAKFI